ncbi:N5-carboxyaminoimidazole ribonucleotide mutase [Enterococcus sp. DIV0212c]
MRIKQKYFNIEKTGRFSGFSFFMSVIRTLRLKKTIIFDLILTHRNSIDKIKENREGKGNVMSVIVSVVMGSTSDWPTMKHACDCLDEFNITYEKKVVSAHRTPDYMFNYAEQARDRGIKVIIAGAGGAAHLPGMIAAKTTLPVIGVPIQSKALNGLDSLLSIVQMPGGVPVATTAIGKAGAVNAGLLAVQMLSMYDVELAGKLDARRKFLEETVMESSDELE